MTLEVVPDGWLEGPMILLWGGGAAQVAELRAAFRELASGVGVRVAFHNLPFMTTAPDSGLVGISSPDGRGVVLSREANRSEWILTPAWWDNADGLLEPFSDSMVPSGGYQFLHQGIGMPVIYSTTRSW